MTKHFKTIGPYTFELNNTMVMVRSVETGELLKAIDYRAHDCVDKFNAICAHWEEKMKVTVSA